MIENDIGYQLILLTEEHLEELYNWISTEKHFEQYTCRPTLKKHKPYDEYVAIMKTLMGNPNQRSYILVHKDDDRKPLGKINLFDYNPRNHSAEFGYYLPETNRNQGLGSIMAEQLINISLADAVLDLNKLYATTSSNNIPSIKLLTKLGFQLDGRLREHYWIGVHRYDQCVYSILKSEWHY
jgi:[ribosomal protein S5]-alanine N-acetyltransferase